MTMQRVEPGGPQPQPPPEARLIGLTTAAWVAQALNVVAALGVADHLADGPRTVDELAAAVGADGPSLYRVLRVLADVEVVAELDGRRFALAELGEPLRRDAPVSLRAWAEMAGAPFHMQALTDLVGAVRTGEPAFERVHGRQAFDWLRDHPAEWALLNDAMTGASSPAVAEVLTAYDFSAAGTVIDVGGGHGVLLAALLQAHPHLHGVVYDLPEVVAGAAPRLDGAGVGARASAVGGDFFRSVPTGADVHVLANIIHDWDDDRAVRILANCRAALNPGGRVLLGEALLPDGPGPSLAKLVDLEMLVMGTGRQRSEVDYRALFRRAGLELVGIGPSNPMYSVVEAVVGRG
ncbi:MAG TPA: methyltransferase [Acidimicrobiales bacterium]|nr:methyltransferase [Acidimicrobiales bacterium]